MRRTLLWILFVFAMIGYSLLVYSWWLEGNAFQRQQAIDQEMETVKLMQNAQGL